MASSLHEILWQNVLSDIESGPKVLTMQDKKSFVFFGKVY